jgi:hypothetical protein
VGGVQKDIPHLKYTYTVSIVHKKNAIKTAIITRDSPTTLATIRANVKSNSGFIINQPTVSRMTR